MTFYFDMDGTIADFYGVVGWLDCLKAKDSLPYEIARPLVNCSQLARLIHRLQNKGHRVAILSWLSKDSNESFNNEITEAKLDWLTAHFPSIEWNEIIIIPYGTPKSDFGSGILFDDELGNRLDWESHGGLAFNPNDMIKVMREF